MSISCQSRRRAVNCDLGIDSIGHHGLQAISIAAAALALEFELERQVMAIICLQAQLIHKCQMRQEVPQMWENQLRGHYTEPMNHQSRHKWTSHNITTTLPRFFQFGSS